MKRKSKVNRQIDEDVKIEKDGQTDRQTVKVTINIIHWSILLIFLHTFISQPDVIKGKNKKRFPFNQATTQDTPQQFSEP